MSYCMSLYHIIRDNRTRDSPETEREQIAQGAVSIPTWPKGQRGMGSPLMGMAARRVGTVPMAPAPLCAGRFRAMQHEHWCAHGNGLHYPLSKGRCVRDNPPRRVL